MNFDFLYSKDDANCYLIINSFATHVNQCVTRTELRDNFGFTNYQLNKYLEQINNDCVQISDGVPSYISEEEKEYWRSHHFPTVIIQKLSLIYLQRSPMYTAFQYLFFFNNRYSRTEYIKKQYLSHSGFYRLLSDLETQLNKNHFYTASGLYDDREFNIRLRLFQLYYSMFNGIAEPFPDFDINLNAIIEKITEISPNHRFTPTQLTKLKTFLKIWLLRLQNENHLDSTPLASIDNDPEWAEWFQELRALFNPEIKISHAELNYLYSFLLTGEFFGSNHSANQSQSFPTASKLTDDFMKTIESTKIFESNASLNLGQLRQGIFEVHLQFTTFYVEPTTFIHPNQVVFFQNLYPIFDLAIAKFTAHLQTISSFTFNQRMLVNLYFSYMFALINNVPPEMLRDKIHVCVDFSQGRLYTNYIIQSLQNFNNANFVIDQHIESSTDIYISDFSTKDVSLPQVIWRDPPTPADWTELADLILDVKHLKLAAMHDVQEIKRGHSNDVK
ncbi:hypothetical protein GPK34_04875 [Secundilactobacillus kimchicus]|uniref:hypothetical protein n=1 Tax=Secundilactobacillus kimchicus TaxID=528209 RepID=UPI001C011036|nr:hypothetical protein [Secundilactobacillus kimchicus]MBT9671368.1 hypothetical protein [Secundilactobacillus kimchicus]